MKVMSFLNSCLCRDRATCEAIFPLHPNQVPDLSLRAALTATSSPPARALAFLSGTETLFETTISCPNGDPFRYA